MLDLFILIILLMLIINGCSFFQPWSAQRQLPGAAHQADGIHLQAARHSPQDSAGGRRQVRHQARASGQAQAGEDLF